MAFAVRGYVGWAVSSAVVGLMFLLSEAVGESEMVFPEVGALAVGLLVVEKRVWAVGRRALPLLMTVAAVMGVCLVRYVAVPQALQMAMGFAGVVLLLSTSRGGMSPAISACLLPVLTGVSSWLYPLSVLGVTAVLLFAQRAMERVGVRQGLPPLVLSEEYELSSRSLARWGERLLLLGAISWFFIQVDWRFAVAPPLVVTFVELTTARSGVTSRYVTVWLLIVAGCVLGVLARLLSAEVSAVVLAPVVFLLMLIVFRVAKRPFAPAAAMSLVPFILPEEEVLWFVVHASVGAGALIFAAKMMRKESLGRSVS